MFLGAVFLRLYGSKTAGNIFERDMNSKRLLVVTTVPQTFFSILKGQPGWLGKYFDVGVATCSR